MLLINNKPLEEDSIFSGGEINIRIPELGFSDSDTVLIEYRGTEPTGLFKLGLVLSAINSNYKYANFKYSLKIPYLPYARQDRICRPGEAFSLEFAMKYLHMLGFSKIITYDIHSGIASAIAIKNKYLEFSFSEFVNSFDFIKGINSLGLISSNLVLLYPDKGAKNRYGRACLVSGGWWSEELPFLDKYHRATRTSLHSEKVRSNGGITQTLDVPTSSIAGKDILIIDDICDGGMTFIELAKLIMPHNPKSIALFVTHGIFRNGTDTIYDSGIDRIITTDSLPQNLNIHKGKFHVFKI